MDESIAETVGLVPTHAYAGNLSTVYLSIYPSIQEMLF